MRIIAPQGYVKAFNAILSNALHRSHRFPFYASFKITSRCHFGCPFCNIPRNRVPDLPTADIIAILDNLSRSSVLMTSFEGGEPLLREDIEELLKHARKCLFYLLFTTSVRDLSRYPLERYARYIDFLHVSIDEGHDNLSLFNDLNQLTKLPVQVSVQTVVTAETVAALDEKIEKCYRAGANIVVIPATVMDDANDCFPDMTALESRLNRLRKQFPDTIHTPRGYFTAYRKGRCSSASVIIAPDGQLYYPCHILGTRGPDLRSVDLMSWLKSREADQYRETMRSCSRNCGWYQYYAVDSYTAPASVWETLKPMLFQNRKMGPGRR